MKSRTALLGLAMNHLQCWLLVDLAEKDLQSKDCLANVLQFSWSELAAPNRQTKPQLADVFGVVPKALGKMAHVAGYEVVCYVGHMQIPIKNDPMTVTRIAM
jgi:hypothetical protein